MNNSACAAAGTSDLVPLSRKPLGVRVAVVLRLKGSNSACGSAMTTEACGTFSPANSLR
ncbi:Uncharacterised protein [Mycobacteroides abscessus]|nr:Uncharacterised protein [Mycobacteroides abscessus]CQA11855.1 Uncharacterised protein [Mycobacteroides abscessus]CQA11953.1 Uncharacterised protein [Mycobacteroides abscessus]SHX07787.1 Uncharacterised protein [Mycobacteroides abscessus subsp. abscessus]SIL87315.1 Uncharacterised protein [Mycobacteroides abscessus subsp. abscessus]